jgi:hypothetical protein
MAHAHNGRNHLRISVAVAAVAVAAVAVVATDRKVASIAFTA